MDVSSCNDSADCYWLACVCMSTCGVKIAKEARTAVSQTLEQTQSRVNKHAGPFRNTFPRVMRWKNCSNATAREEPTFRPAVAQLIRTTKTNTAVWSRLWPTILPAPCVALFCCWLCLMQNKANAWRWANDQTVRNFNSQTQYFYLLCVFLLWLWK